MLGKVRKNVTIQKVIHLHPNFGDDIWHHWQNILTKFLPHPFGHSLPLFSTHCADKVSCADRALTDVRFVVGSPACDGQ